MEFPRYNLVCKLMCISAIVKVYLSVEQAHNYVDYLHRIYFTEINSTYLIIRRKIYIF